MIGVWSFQSRVRSSALVLVVSTAAVALVAGCGGAAPEAASPAAKSPESGRSKAAEPSTIEEAQAEIAAARAELGGDRSPSLFAPAPPSAAPAPAPVSPGSASTPSTSTRTSPAAPPSADSAARPSAQDRCGSPCRALASMRRAVTALCRMTGNDDARCADAKRTLVDSEGRVAPCAC